MIVKFCDGEVCDAAHVRESVLILKCFENQTKQFISKSKELSEMSKEFSRREVFKMGLVAVGTALLTKVVSVPLAFAANAKKPPTQPPAGKKVADPLSGAGKTQGYKHFASEYPKKKPNWPANANCANCIHNKADPSSSDWAPCAVLAQSWVYKEGLCNLYMKNPKAAV